MNTIKLAIEFFLALFVTAVVASAIAITVSVFGFDSASVYIGTAIIMLGLVFAIARFWREIRIPQQTA